MIWYLIWVALLIFILGSTALLFYVLLDFYKKYTPRKVYKLYLDFIHKEEPGPYQVSLAEKYTLNPTTDEFGAVVYKHYLTGDKPYVHPIRNTHVALAYYESYILTYKNEDLERFFRVIKAFMNHVVELDNGAYIWYYPPYVNFENQKVPWTSAMSQGQMLAVLAIAYYETKDIKYLEIGKKVLLSFQTKIEDGGVLFEDDFGIFYEEFAYWEPQKRNHTLNGMLSALFGIYDFWKVSKFETAFKVFETGVKTIRKNLHLYDLSYCSTYDLRHLVDPEKNFPLVQGRYNAVHVGHLRILAEMTNDSYFQAVSDLWDKKLQDKVNRIRLTFWYLGYKSFDIRATIKRYGLIKAIWINAERFFKKKPMI